MTVVPQGHVAVYLVADDNDAMLCTEMCEAAESLSVPADAGGIMWIAYDEQAHSASRVSVELADKSLQAVDIHIIAAVLPLYEWILQQLSAVALSGEAEGVVDGRLYDDSVFLIAEDIDGEAYPPYYSRYECQPLAPQPPCVVVSDPVYYARPEVGGLNGISIERVVEALSQRLCDEWRCLPVHICHP